MNKKLVRGSLAGVAVIALAAGGTTFSAWSDFDTLEGSNVGADQLTLVLDEPNTQDFDNVKLAPGVGSDFEFVVASRDGETVPEADLTLALAELVGTEDGCTSTNSEAADPADTNCEGGRNTAPGAGEFDDQAIITVNISQPTTDRANACNSSAHPRGAALGRTTLSDAEDMVVELGRLSQGEAVCVAMGLSLPVTATDATQGDSASFDLDFFLDQVV